MENLKKTPLYNVHKELGGKIIDFSGWALPVQYEGIISEHQAIRNAVGLFDVSHMGEIEISGGDAASFVQRLITNDISNLIDNQIIYSPMCNHDGGILDDLLVYKYNSKHYLLVVNAGNTQKDYNWIIKNSQDWDVSIKDLSNKYSLLALQGPKAEEVLGQAIDMDLSELKFFYFNPEANIQGINVLVSRTGYTGEDGFEIYCANEDVAKLWDLLLNLGKDFGIQPAGLGARDTLRFEAGLPLYGNEISEDITPLEGGLSFFVKLDKGDFIGKEALLKQREEGLKRKLVGIELERGIPRQGYWVLLDGRPIGEITTGYRSPTLKTNIAMALIEKEQATLGQEVQVEIRKKVFTGKIVSKNFYKRKK